MCQAKWCREVSLRSFAGVCSLLIFLGLTRMPQGIVRSDVGATCIVFVGEVSERWLIRSGGDPKGQCPLPGVVYLHHASTPTGVQPASRTSRTSRTLYPNTLSSHSIIGIRCPLLRRRVRQGVSEETGHTERGRRWGLATRPATSVYLLNGFLGEGLLDEVALDAHLGRALEVLLTELHLSDLLVGVEEGIDLLAHLLECCLGLLLLLL